MADITKSKDNLELCYLDPNTLHFLIQENGIVRLTIKDECSYPNVTFFRCFPLETKDQFISIRNGLDNGDTEIGIVPDLNALDDRNRAIVEEALARRYFVPLVLSVLKIEELFGRYIWNVETDKGPRELTIKDMNTNIRFLGDYRMLIIDADGCRYYVPNFQQLDSTSLRYLSRYLLV